MRRWRGSTRRSAIVDPIALTALAIDAAVGWPAGLYARIGHPVGGFARIIGGCETRWNRSGRQAATRRLAGIGTLLLVVGIAVLGGWMVTKVSHTLFGDCGWVLIALCAWPGLAQRSLDDHVRPVAIALLRGNLSAARCAVARIVGRDTEALDESGIARAAIESLAESFCDGVVAPLFWLLLLGLPGLWAYKAINTADSLIGHREPRWRDFGWAAARIDDVANLIPARLSGLAIAIASGSGFATMLRDAGKHASPNAGWPEAAMAGALGMRLAGPIAYDRVLHDKPWIGDGRADAGGADISRALAIYRRACLMLWVIAGAVAWAR